MKLSVREAAKLLNASEKSVYRWIKQGLLPAYRINDQYRINPPSCSSGDVRKISVSPTIFEEPEDGDAPPPPLDEALRAGASTTDSVGTQGFRAARRGRHHEPAGRCRSRVSLSGALAREALGSTGIGDGIAIPHVRNPIVLHLSRRS